MQKSPTGQELRAKGAAMVGGMSGLPGQPPDSEAGSFFKRWTEHDFSGVPAHSWVQRSGPTTVLQTPLTGGASRSDVDRKVENEPRAHESPAVMGGLKTGGSKTGDSRGEDAAFIGGDGADDDQGAHRSTLSYRESNELLECIRIMGQENAAFCREQARNPANWGTHSAIVATETTSAGPTYNPCGDFLWHSAFATSGRSGFLVQQINNGYNVQTCGGAPIPNPHPTPVYYEAWQVDAAGNVSPKVGAVNDMWIRPARPNTKGSWSMTGNVHWAKSLEPAAGFGAGNVQDAGILQSTLTQPTNIANPILTRRKGGTWDCCAGKNTHTATG